MRSLTIDHDKRFVAGAAHCAAWRSGSSSIAGRKAGHGNGRAWKAMMPAIPPFPHSLEIPSGFPHSHGLDDRTYVFSSPLNSNHRHRKGLVTDVSVPQRNACPGAFTPWRGLSTLFSAKRWEYQVGVAGRNETVTKLPQAWTLFDTAEPSNPISRGHGISTSRRFMDLRDG